MKVSDIRIMGPGMPGRITLLQVETDAGITGIGATQSPAGPVAALVEDIKPLVIGEDPSDPGRLWRRMNEGWPALRGRAGEGGIAINAMAAIDIGVWDIAGKARGEPIHKLMGGAVKDRIAAYASATCYDYKVSLNAGEAVYKSSRALVAESRAYLDAGFKAIKFGWGNRFEPADLETLAAVRDAVGPDTHLMLDFGCPAYHDNAWSVEAAIEVAQRLQPFNLFFLEEALHPYDEDGFAKLTAASPVPIATGESLTTLRDFERFIDRRAVNIIQPDALQIGMTVLRQVADRAQTAGMLCIPHSPWSALSAAAHLQILSTFRSSVMIEYIAMAGFRRVPFLDRFYDGMLFRAVDTPTPFTEGCLELSERPGLGLGGFVPRAVDELEKLRPVAYP